MRKSALLALAGVLLSSSFVSAQNLTCGPTETPVTLEGPGPAKLLACTPETTPPSWKVSVNGQVTDLGVLQPAGPQEASSKLTPYLLPVTFPTAGTYTVTQSSYNAAGNTVGNGTITVTVTATQPPPTGTLTETGNFSGTGTASTVNVNVTANANARLVAMVAGDKGGSGQTTSVSGGNVTWGITTNGQANGGGGVAAIWTGVTSTALANVPITCKLGTGTFFVRCQIVALDGSAAIGTVVKASGSATTASAAGVSLTPQAAGSFVYGAGTNTLTLAATTPLTGQTKLGESLAANAGTFWMQKLTAPTASVAALTIGTSAPSIKSWNFVAAEVKAATGPTPPPTCTYAVSPTQIVASVDGVSAPVTITASSGTCAAWTAASSQPWATVAPSSGTGAGTVTATIASNPAIAARAATLTIAGQAVNVTQPGDSPPTAVGTGVATFAVTVSDDRGVVSVICMVDGQSVGTLTAPPFVCSVGAEAGTHTVSARVTDTADQTATVTLGTVVR